jgi:hypothetical protein
MLCTPAHLSITFVQINKSNQSPRTVSVIIPGSGERFIAETTVVKVTINVPGPPLYKNSEVKSG